MSNARPNERENILNLQRYLRQLSFDFEEIPAVPIDGIFESVTEDALRAYQKLKGLEITGRADTESWTRLFEDYLLSIEQNTRGNGFYIFPRLPQGSAVYPGEQHFLVTVIQYILNELRIFYTDIPLNDQNGVYDEMTRQGILEFQRRTGLPETDRVDLMTWNAMVDAHRRLVDRDEL